MHPTIYQSEEDRTALLALYEQKMRDTGLSPYEDRYLETAAGRTHVIVAGNPQGPPLVLLHGINAGAPLALEPMAPLGDHYCLYGIDTLGQVGKSDPVRLPLRGATIGDWLVDCLDQLELRAPAVVGISYGAFLLQRLLARAPQRVGKAIFLVPAGFSAGSAWSTWRQITWPLLRFMWRKGERELLAFMKAFVTEVDEWTLAFQRRMLLGVKVDFRRPPMATAAELAAVEAPVYLLAVENDVFFPTEQSLEKCRRFFKNFRGYHILKASKHVPAPGRFPEIAEQIEKWLVT